MEMIKYQWVYFFFLKILFNFLILLLFDNNNDKLTFLLENLYFLGNELQILLKKVFAFFNLFDQAFSSEKTLILIIIRVSFYYFGYQRMAHYV